MAGFYLEFASGSSCETINPRIPRELGSTQNTPISTGRWSISWNVYCSRVEEQGFWTWEQFVWVDSAGWKLRSIGTLGKRRMTQLGLTLVGAWKPLSATKCLVVRIWLYLICVIDHLYPTKDFDTLAMCFYRAGTQPETSYNAVDSIRRNAIKGRTLEYIVYSLFSVHEFSQYILLLDLEVEGSARGGGRLPNSLLYPKSQFIIVRSTMLHSL